ncbi:MAG: aminotransferase class V-fold PLP-dependent enzyme [Candidatus Eisenbacteria sp.]|nr:aminotransferase class V-fold PLP-dependent enzyme [Candidatus Eisenbacteria bacterium]
MTATGETDEDRRKAGPGRSKSTRSVAGARGLGARSGASEFARHWSLDPHVAFLNHGSFGACPIPVLEAQTRLRDRLERGPVQFLLRELDELATSARAETAAFVGVDPDDLVFVANATTGVNTILRSLNFEPGDELLTTSHEYNACRNAMDFVAGRSGARVIAVDVPFPVGSPDEIMELLLDGASDRTRLAVVDHITSLTGIVMPIKRIVRAFAERGIETLVDGAHGPGMLPLDITDIRPAFYTGNCHKWLCTPKGAALLYVRRDLQPSIRPLTLSHGANSRRTDVSRFQLEFGWTGTDDPTPYLCIPESIRFMGSLLPGGWSELMERNRDLALRARALLCEAVSVAPACPDEMIGTLASVPLSEGTYHFTTTALEFDELNTVLREEYGFEVPVLAYPPGPASIIRVAAQVYNSIEQYAALADTLKMLLGR